jgi:hypothetical protein
VTAGLFDALALAIALFEQPQVVLHVFVAGILALCSRERRVRAFVAITQHVREALIVENLDGRSNDADRLTIGAVGEIKPAQAIVGGGKADPGLGIARMLLDRGTEMLFGKTVVARAEVFLAETQLIVWVAAEKTLHRFPGTPTCSTTVPVVSSAACAESGASALACASEASAAGDFDVKILERPFEVLHPASHSAAAATVSSRVCDRRG